MTDNLNTGGSSKFLEVRKFFYSKKEGEIDRVEVFVEDGIDSIFWRNVLEEITSDKIFKIRVLRTNDELNGKDSLISKIGFSSLGPNKLIAIDSDYDYIIDNYHNYTNELRNCPYILHTGKAYSIENHKCHPQFLRRAIYMCSFCEEITENIEDMFYSASKLYYPLFSMHLFLISKHDKFYTQSCFKADLHRLQFLKDSISQNTLNYISQKEKSIRKYIDNNYTENDFKDFITHINNLGVRSNSCWQYMNGHDILSEIALKITQPISSKYRKKYMDWIYAHITQEDRRENLKNKFYNSTKIELPHKLRDRLIELFYDFSLDFKIEPSKGTLNEIAAIIK